MFARLAALASLAVLAAAAPGGSSASQCDTGSMKCCDSTTAANSAAGAAMLASLGIVLQDANVVLGQGCSPLTVVGLGNGECTASPVCCEDNSSGNLISIGCVPIQL